MVNQQVEEFEEALSASFIAYIGHRDERALPPEQIEHMLDHCLIGPYAVSGEECVEGLEIVLDCRERPCLRLRVIPPGNVHVASDDADMMRKVA